MQHLQPDQSIFANAVSFSFFYSLNQVGLKAGAEELSEIMPQKPGLHHGLSVVALN
jgi:hypothetical protein